MYASIYVKNMYPYMCVCISICAFKFMYVERFLYVCIFARSKTHLKNVCIYIYSDPTVDRIFFGGCGIYVGIMLDVGQRKKTVVGILVVPPGRSKTGSWNMVLEG